MTPTRLAAQRTAAAPIAPAEPAGRPVPLPTDAARARPVIVDVHPSVDAGRRPAKAAVGDVLTVSATAFVDGHDLVCCELETLHHGQDTWHRTTMAALAQDCFEAPWPITATGWYRFAVRAWIDRFAGWRRDLRARAAAGQPLASDLAVGAALARRAAAAASGADRTTLDHLAACFDGAVRGLESPVPADLVPLAAGPSTLGDLLEDRAVTALMTRYADRSGAALTSHYALYAEPAKARFSTWYELFPRSAASDPTRHGTFADVVDRLDHVADMGFDVLYLPPIHPIGLTGRKGRDGSTVAEPGDPGSVWAIGSPAGGHTAVHPDLGTVADFTTLLAEAARRGIDLAIDLAFQASPDHPWVTEHPGWFAHRPDGTIACAENPPKRYEDIYPFDFDTSDWPALWDALLGVVRYWCDLGVTVFRVDNPHTKPFAFWEWLISSIRVTNPGTIFLSEAFTKPLALEELAKAGFSQSYTYFTWRTTKWELQTYLGELTSTGVRDYLRPNLWPNTPDILPAELQRGRPAAFVARLVLAATLSASYGIYGPAFELMEHVARQPGTEEYAHSEKYELRGWDLARPDSLAPVIARVNRARHDHPALQHNDRLCFHPVDNDRLLAYSKTRAASPVSGERDVIVTVVNLDDEFAQSGWVDLDLDALGLDCQRPFVLHDLLTGAQYQWHGARNFVRLDPAELAAHLFWVVQPDDGRGDGPGPGSSGPDGPTTEEAGPTVASPPVAWPLPGGPETGAERGAAPWPSRS